MWGYLVLGVYLVPGGVLSLGGWGYLVPGVYLVRGVWSWRGCLVLGMSGPGGVSGPWEMVSQHALRQTPPCGQTHACKNITLATTSLRLVKIDKLLSMTALMYLNQTSVIGDS